MTGTTGVDQFAMQFTSDFQEKDIVFGGDKKLEKMMDEAQVLFPLDKGISVLSECPIGLIGDDINSVAKKSTEELERPIIPCTAKVSAACPSRSATTSPTTRSATTSSAPVSLPNLPDPYDIALIGDYNIGGDVWSAKPLAGGNRPAT